MWQNLADRSFSFLRILSIKEKETTRLPVGTDQPAEITQKTLNGMKQKRNFFFSSERKRRRECRRQNYLVRDRERNNRAESRREISFDRSPMNRGEAPQPLGLRSRALRVPLLRTNDRRRNRTNWASRLFTCARRESLTRTRKRRLGAVTRVYASRRFASLFITHRRSD